MDDVDFDLAFELYDKPKAKLETYHIPTPIPAPQSSTSHSTYTHPSTTHSLYRTTGTNPRISGSGTHTGAQFRSSFSTTSPPKPSQISPLSISHSTPAAPINGNRNFILPPKPAHHRNGPNRVIQIDHGSSPLHSPLRPTMAHFPTSVDTIGADPDSDDDILAPVLGISKPHTTSSPKKTSSRPPSTAKRTSIGAPAKMPARRAPHDANNHTIVLENMETEVPVAADRAALAFPPECNADAAKIWLYPNNYEKRDYQFAMVQSALFKNTLVCLPTGLGKTLIAAVVLYNFYRWFPNGKIIFMAPTKPLVTQQLGACRDIVSIPPEDSIVMTGQISAETRAKHWASKRIFFVTPQVPQNDIASGICPADQVCLLIFDEAHKAHGDYAYCDVIRGIAKATPYFRVLALSATPGSDLASIQDVLTNLLISKIELRTEDSPDVKPYLHTRFVDEIKVKLDGPIVKAKEMLRAIINLPIAWLQSHNALYRIKKGDYFTFTRLEAARADFRRNEAMQRKDEYFKGQVEARFAAAMSMYHGSHLITDYGLGPFKDWINAQTMKPVMEKTSQFFAEMVSSKEWHTLSLFVNEGIGDPNACRHPKLKHLESLVLDHFHDTKEALVQANPSSTTLAEGDGTRIMIFVHFRDTVEEIVSMLKSHSPTIRPMAFIGQSKKGLSQKQQAEVVRKFREGHFNTLVSTSIGEEGLDIGEVDLIICYDTQQSPIRMIQRMGRTGRKRNGRCVMLLTEGSEDITLKRSKTKGKAMIKAISGNSKFHFFNGSESAKLLPEGIHPTPLMHFMEKMPESDVATKAKRSTTKSKRAKKSTAMDMDNDEETEACKEPTENLEELEMELGSEGPLSSDDDEEEEDGEDDANAFGEDGMIQAEEEDEKFEDALAEVELLRSSNTRPTSTPAPVVIEDSGPISSTPPPRSYAPPDSPNTTLIDHILNPTKFPEPPQAKAPIPVHTQSLPTIAKSVVNRIPSAKSILDQSQTSVEPSLHLALDEFPAGFFDIVQPSSSIIDIPPPPLSNMMPLDFDLGFTPSKSAKSVPSPVPPSTPFLSPSTALPNPVKDAMVFHTAFSSPNPKPITPQTQSPSPKKIPSSTSPLPDSLSLSHISLESPPPTKFKRIRKTAVDDSITSSMLDESKSPVKLVKHISPPAPKRQCLPGGRRRLLQEEASLDEENSDGGDYSGDEANDDFANSQDLAFIASEDSDVSITKMRSVYAKSLESASYGLGRDAVSAMTWIDGTDLSAKFQRWNEYSDMESTSEVNSSHHTMDSIMEEEMPAVPTTKAFAKEIVIHSVESSPASTPPADIQSRPTITAPPTISVPKLGIARPAGVKLGLSQAKFLTRSPSLTVHQAIEPPRPTVPQHVQSTTTAKSFTKTPAVVHIDDNFDYGITDDELLMIDVDNVRR